jgi:hypothetical protein
MRGDRDLLSSLNCALEWVFCVAVRRFVFSAADRLCRRLPAGSQLQHAGCRRGSRAAAAAGRAWRPLRT